MQKTLSSLPRRLFFYVPTKKTPFFALFLLMSGMVVMAQTGPNDDYDGDGIANITDLDDDNDGILDSVENPLSGAIITPINSGITQEHFFQSSDRASNLITATEDEFSDGVDLTDRLVSPKTGTSGRYFGDNGRTTTWWEFPTFPSNSNIRGMALWNPDYQPSLNHTDSGIRQFTVELDHSGGTTTIGPFFAEVDPEAQLFDFMQTFNSVTRVRVNVLDSWRDVDKNGIHTVAPVPSTATEYNIVVFELRFIGVSTNIDTDGDGILNQFDLDSDGDGCPDTLESGIPTSDLQSGTLPDGSSGTDTTFANGQVSGPYGSNGLANGVTIADTDDTVGVSVNVIYESDYKLFAVSAGLNACDADGDGDGTSDAFDDADDDNDGILDAVESSSCYYVASDFTSGNRLDLITVTTELEMTANDNEPHKMVDGQLGIAVVFRNNRDITGKTIFQFEFPVPVDLSRIDLQYLNTNSLFAANAKVDVEASDDGVNWTVVRSKTIASANNGDNEDEFDNINAAVRYRLYRLRGTDGSTRGSGEGRLTEVHFTFDTFSSSLSPKPSCNVDNDGDGLLSHLDLDADGDGCPDALEGSATIDPADLVVSASLDGGNSGGSYTGSSSEPIFHNLGTTVSATGVPTIVGSGQGLGSSQNGGTQNADCDNFEIGAKAYMRHGKYFKDGARHDMEFGRGN